MFWSKSQVYWFCIQFTNSLCIVCIALHCFYFLLINQNLEVTYVCPKAVTDLQNSLYYSPVERMITTVILPINWQTKHLALKHTGLIWRSSILAEKIPIIPPLLVNDKLESDFKNKVHYFNVCFASKCTLLIKLVSTIFYIF